MDPGETNKKGSGLSVMKWISQKCVSKIDFPIVNEITATLLFNLTMRPEEITVLLRSEKIHYKTIIIKII